MKFFKQPLRFQAARWFAAAVLLAAATASAQSGKPVPPASEVYKNLKVLGATPSDSLNQGMHLISGESGVDYEYCHAEHMQWELDEKKTKDTVRDMMTMMNEPAGPCTEIATHSTIRITKIQENVALDDAKFNRPPPVERGGKKKQ